MRPSISYLICTTPRTGCSYLCSMLFDTGVAGRPGEYFWRSEIANDEKRWDFREYVSIVRQGRTPNGVFGSKVIVGDDTFTQLARDLMQARMSVHNTADLPLLSDFRFLCLLRRNKVRQAISWYRAIHTNTWFTLRGQREKRSNLSLNVRAINHLVCEISRREALAKAFLDAQDYIPMTIFYEDIVESPEKTVADILGWLQVGGSLPIRLDLCPYMRQADDLTDEWENAYRSAYGSLDVAQS